MQKAGLRHVHRELGPVKPHCQFDEVIKGPYNYTAKFEGQGCTIEQMTGGIAAGDFDNDGHVDLFFTVYFKPSILYRNNGKWSRLLSWYTTLFQSSMDVKWTFWTLDGR